MNFFYKGYIIIKKIKVSIKLNFVKDGGPKKSSSSYGGRPGDFLKSYNTQDKKTKWKIHKAPQYFLKVIVLGSSDLQTSQNWRDHKLINGTSFLTVPKPKLVGSRSYTDSLVNVSVALINENLILYICLSNHSSRCTSHGDYESLFKQFLPSMYMNWQDWMSVWIMNNNQEEQVQVVLLFKTKCFPNSLLFFVLKPICRFGLLTIWITNYSNFLCRLSFKQRIVIFCEIF